LDLERVDPSFAIHERKNKIAYNAVSMHQTKLGGSAMFRACEIRSKNFHKLKQLSQSRGTLEYLKNLSGRGITTKTSSALLLQRQDIIVCTASS
jgi:hypothetical protein